MMTEKQNSMMSLRLGFLVFVTCASMSAQATRMKRYSNAQQGGNDWGWRSDSTIRQSEKQLSGATGGPSTWPSSSTGPTTKGWPAPVSPSTEGWPSQSKVNDDYDYSEQWQQWSQQKGGTSKGSEYPNPEPKEGRLEDILKGVPGEDFPNFITVPDTDFDCAAQLTRGYYGDVEAGCQVFHICQPEGRKDSFLCPVGTIFNQKYFVCDWWFNVNCSDSPSYYNLNAEIYKEEGPTEGAILVTTETPIVWSPPTTNKGVPAGGWESPVINPGKPTSSWGAGKGSQSPSSWRGDAGVQTGPWDQINPSKGGGRNSWGTTSGGSKPSLQVPKPGFSGSPQGPKAGFGGTPQVPKLGSGSFPGNKKGSNPPVQTKPNVIEVKAQIGRGSHVNAPIVFGARTKALNNPAIAVTPGVWRPTETLSSGIEPAAARRGIVKKGATNIKGSGGWYGNENTVGRFTHRDGQTNTLATSIIPTRTKAVWEQESIKPKVTTIAWVKEDAGFDRHGLGTKSAGSKYTSRPTERETTIATDSSYGTEGAWDDWTTKYQISNENVGQLLKIQKQTTGHNEATGRSHHNSKNQNRYGLQISFPNTRDSYGPNDIAPARGTQGSISDSPYSSTWRHSTKNNQKSSTPNYSSWGQKIVHTEPQNDNWN